MLTVLSVFGTRPEAIKLAPVILRLQQYPDQIRSVVCLTGQHQEMVRSIMPLFQIEPDYDLGLMQPDQTLVDLTTTMLQKLSQVTQEVKPDWILAQGDTTTVLVASLVAYYQRIRFGHIEAGLRTGNKYAPYPEEGNRVVADRLADICFTPTLTARDRLLAESIPPEQILVTGNTVVDALLNIAQQPYTQVDLDAVPSDKRLVLVTAHRRESFGAAFRDICLAIRDLATRYPDVSFVYPVHLNPNVQQPVRELLTGYANIHLLPPLDYPSLIHLMRRAEFILTDSGGIQEEAPTFKVPLLVMRVMTERPEGIAAGVAKLVATDRTRIVEESAHLLDNPAARIAMQGENPYGDGLASSRIVDYLLTQAHRTA